MNLSDYLDSYNQSDSIPFHMPGHKRNTDFAEYLRKMYADIDFTEIDKTDDLHHAQGILKECMQKAERLWNSRHSFLMVNGSTGGILSGIRACVRYGDEILVARNCHKSVYHAIELLGLKPVYLLPEYNRNYSVYGSINPKNVEKILHAHPSVKLVVITSPTYEGVISNVQSISAVVHQFKIPLMVDEAHGSHLDLSEYFVGGAVKGGADIVVQSLHKTLPSLTQSAVIHLNSDIVSAENLQRQLAIFQTSSPSYLLMSSADCCIELIRNRELFKTWHDNLALFREKVAVLRHLKIMGYTDDIRQQNGISQFDYSKILISCACTDITGNRLMEMLRNDHHIECEMCNSDYVLAMTSMADTKENLLCLAESLICIDRKINPYPPKNRPTFVTEIPQKKFSVTTALDIPNTKKIPYTQSIGETSAEYIWIYPPGIPVITPGEIISSEITEIIHTAIRYDMNLQKTFSQNKNEITVIYNT